MGLRVGDRVLDVASGIGTTALLLAAERGVEVVGVDLGAAQVARAHARAVESRLDGAVRFEVGDAERLPIYDERFDARGPVSRSPISNATTTPWREPSSR